MITTDVMDKAMGKQKLWNTRTKTTVHIMLTGCFLQHLRLAIVGSTLCFHESLASSFKLKEKFCVCIAGNRLYHTTVSANSALYQDTHNWETTHIL